MMKFVGYAVVGTFTVQWHIVSHGKLHCPMPRTPDVAAQNTCIRLHYSCYLGPRAYLFKFFCRSNRMVFSLQICFSLQVQIQMVCAILRLVFFLSLSSLQPLYIELDFNLDCLDS